jgi:YfiH family protein
MTAPAWIEPDWPAPPGIRAASTLRAGGGSEGPYSAFNLGTHVGDDPARVAQNRRRLGEHLNLPAEPVWLTQVHGTQALAAEAPGDCIADAAYTRKSGVVCVVMTADCLPILLASRDGSAVAAVHAGWKGLAGGVVESAVAALGTRDLLAWLGPAIGPEAFEVGGEVREAFVRRAAKFEDGFRAAAEDKWLADLYRLARITLERLEIDEVYGGGWCTFGQSDDFFSYRRDRITGRMASLIWREE